MGGSLSEVGFDIEVLDERPGQTVLKVSGQAAAETFRDESGGHRFQRPSPTDKRGRVHSSTITVAVMTEPTDVDVQLHERDLQYQTCRGSGAGGQNRNRRDTAVQLTHLPSGIMIRCEAERSQGQNKATALSLLRIKLWTAQRDQAQAAQAQDRRGQVGSGQRGDKRRTIRTVDDSVVDHLTGKTWSWKRYRKGDWA